MPLVQEPSCASRIPFLAVLLWRGLLFVELCLSVYLRAGQLVFTLAGPNIRFAVADHAMSAGCGVNGSDVSSPSSSIVWPYLIAATELLHLGAFIPLLINAIAAFRRG
jgi:hypothetical protein